MQFRNSFEAGAIRCAALAAIGGSSSLAVLSFWGPSVEHFYEQAYLFAALAVLAAVIAMVLGARRFDVLPVSVPSVAGVIVVTLLAAIPGGILFVVLPRLSVWLWLGALFLGLAVASLLFPKNRRRWIPLLWLGSAVVVGLSRTAQSILTDPGANSSEGISMLIVQLAVWLAVLVAAMIVASAVGTRRGDQGAGDDVHQCHA